MKASIGTRVTVTLTVIVTLIFLRHWFQLAANLLFLLAVAASSGVIKPLINRMLPFLYIALVMVAMHSFFNPHNTDYVYFFGVQGFSYGLTVALRLLCLVTAANYLLLSTDASALVQSMGRLHPDLGLIMGLVMSMLPAMRLQLSTTLEAQAARGMRSDRGLRDKFHAYLSVIIPVIIKSIFRAQAMARLLYLRGYGKLSGNRVIYMKKGDWLYLSGGTLYSLINIFILLKFF